jgi:hypothetical protein
MTDKASGGELEATPPGAVPFSSSWSTKARASSGAYDVLTSRDDLLMFRAILYMFYR